jgi:hypothetical protein
MGGKAGDGECNRKKLNFTVTHCRWGERRVCGNCGSAAKMSRRAAIHGTLGVVGGRGKSRFRLWRRCCVVVVMLVRRTVTVVCNYGMA